jgi:predicted methyltransferase
MTRKELARTLARQLNPQRGRWQNPRTLVRELGLRPGQAVAEIGSGPGYFTPRLARAVGPRGHVYAVDPEAAVLDVLRRRLGRLGVRNVTPVLGRDDDPMLPRGRCQIAVLINVYHHMHRGAVFLRRLVAALPRNATVVNVDWNETSDFGPPPRRRVSRPRFLRDARRAGLRLVADRRLLPHQYFLVLRRAR